MATNKNESSVFTNSYYDNLFRNTDYWEQYQSINQWYSQAHPHAGFWDTLTGQAQRDLNQHNKDYADKIQALVDQMRKDEYNSPVEQVARDKQAGLNPDLIGVSDVGQTDSANVPSTPYSPTSSFQQVTSFLSTIGSALVGASNFIPTLQNNLLSVKVNRLQYAKEMDNYIIQSLADLGPDVLAPEKGDNVISPSFSLGFTNLSRRESKKADERAVYLAETLATRGKQYGTKLAHDKNRKDIFDIRSSAGFSEDDEEFFKKLAPEMAELAQIVFEAEGISSAENAWASHDEAKNRRTMAKIRSMEKGIMRTIRDSAEKGNIFAAGVIMSMFAPNAEPPSGQLFKLAKLFLK